MVIGIISLLRLHILEKHCFPKSDGGEPEEVGGKKKTIKNTNKQNTNKQNKEDNQKGEHQLSQGLFKR